MADVHDLALGNEHTQAGSPPLGAGDFRVPPRQGAGMLAMPANPNGPHPTVGPVALSTGA